jgi:aspartate racemase
MSWESTAEYYRILNEEVARRLGGLASARLYLASVDFAAYEARMRAGAWDEIRDALVGEALGLRRAGAEALVVATNTMHRFAPELEAATGLPLLHIADAAAGELRGRGLRRPGLLGTRYTMEGDFYSGRLRDRYGMETLVPPARERLEVDRIIFAELCRGDFREASVARLREAAIALEAAGADCVILGCTELPLVMKEGDIGLPYLDTTRLHALAAVDFMLGGHAAGSASPPAHPSVAAMWYAYLASLDREGRAKAEGRGYTAWHFCADERNADELGALTLSGRKRATATSLRALEGSGEAAPCAGDLSVITDWAGRALCIIETERITVRRFEDVDAAFAAREGEGDGSLEYWREGHARFFGAEHAALRLPFGGGNPILCEEFRVVWPS